MKTIGKVMFYLVVAVIAIMLSLLTLIRKYRFYSFTVGFVTDIVQEVDERIHPEKVEAAELVYLYSDDETGKEVKRDEPLIYLNRVIGEEVKYNAGYNNNPVYLTFTPEYINGYIYPDLTQEEIPAGSLYAYTDEETGEVWYSKNPYSYKNKVPGKYYCLTPFDNPLQVVIRMEAEYESGIIYPDGTQEEVH